MRHLSLGLRILLTLIFVGAGGAKLLGVSMMVDTFDAIGWGQWFRYVTGLVEVSSAALLWVPGLQIVGAGLLAITMICAVLFHLLLLGPSAVPALVLGVLSLVAVYLHREQLSAVQACSPAS